MPKRSQDIPEEYTAYEQALARAMGARIRDHRDHLGLTQEQVRARMELERVYVSRARYSRIEIGDALLRASEMLALMRALGVSCTWLLLGEQASPETP